MSALFTPLTIRETVFQNRVWVSPMCQYQATNGHIGQWHRSHLGALATGQADAVFLARAMLRNPRWALNAAEKLGIKIDWPLSLDRARTLN